MSGLIEEKDAQALHEVIGAAIEELRNHNTSEALTLLEAARAQAAVIVSDTQQMKVERF